jgi:hypothetical protein
MLIIGETFREFVTSAPIGADPFAAGCKQPIRPPERQIGGLSRSKHCYILKGGVCPPPEIGRFRACFGVRARAAWKRVEGPIGGNHPSSELENA